MGQVVASTLEPLAGGLAVLFLAIAAVQRFAMEPPFPGVMAPYSVGMSLVFGGIYAAARRRGIPARWSHAVGTAYVLLVLTGTVLPFALIQDPLQTTDLVLVAMGVGAVFVSQRWFLANLAVVTAIFGAFVAANPGYSRWPNLGVAVLSASVIGYVVLEHRSRLLGDLHDLRARDAQHREQLQDRMDRIEALRERAERDRARAERYASQLEETNRDLHRFAESLSRQLMVPVERVRDRLASARNGGGAVDEALEDLQGMDATLRSLLEYARVASADVDLEPLEFGPVLAEAWRAAAGDGDATPDPPEMGDLPEVVGDRDLLVRLFEELLDNALRHGEPPVCVSADLDGSAVRVVVTDHGPGVDPGKREQAFRLLAGDDRSRPGVGLPLCRRIAERLGGDVALADPSEGGGARFVVTLKSVGRIGASAVREAAPDGRTQSSVRPVDDAPADRP